MAIDQIEMALSRTWRALGKELRDISELHFPTYSSENSDTGGRYATVATWAGWPDVDLWLDVAAGEDRPRFWVGFYTEDLKKMDRLIALLPKKLKPSATYSETAWKKEPRGPWFFKEPKEELLSRPYLERYPKVWHTHFFGFYDWGGHATKSGLTLDLWKAAEFIKDVVSLANLAPNDHAPRSNDPEKRALVEKVAVTYVAKHFERQDYQVTSVEKDNLGWDLQARKGNQRLRIEVKGLSGSAIVVEVTPNEYKQIVARREDYRLCIVSDALEAKKAKLRIFSYQHRKKAWLNEQREKLLIQEMVAARLSARR